MSSQLPDRYLLMRQRHAGVLDALDGLGRAARGAGPLDEKTGHLIQLAAAAAIRSEGAVHSHVRRAKEAGATQQEIEHALLLLTSTIGYPTVTAAMSWADDAQTEPS